MGWRLAVQVEVEAVLFQLLLAVGPWATVDCWLLWLGLPHQQVAMEVS